MNRSEYAPAELRAQLEAQTALVEELRAQHATARADLLRTQAENSRLKDGLDARNQILQAVALMFVPIDPGLVLVDAGECDAVLRAIGKLTNPLLLPAPADPPRDRTQSHNPTEDFSGSDY